MPDKKEIKHRDSSGEVVSELVDAEELDKEMQDADRVFGVDGDKEERAAYVSKDPTDTPDEPVTGERGA
jgi:hypothetical protein